MEKAYLEYRGRGKIFIEIHRLSEKGKRRRVLTSMIPNQKRPFNFEIGEVLDEIAINYYRQLEAINIFLHMPKELKIESQNEIPRQSEDMKLDVENSNINEQASNINDNSENSFEGEEISEDTATTDITTENNTISEIDNAELVAYLDVTYDREGLKGLAEQFGIEFNSRISSEKLIEKLVTEKPEEIANLING